jgi:hypothetical protein
MSIFNIRFGEKRVEIVAPTYKDAIAKVARSFGITVEQKLKKYIVPTSIYSRRKYTVEAQNANEAIRLAKTLALKDKESVKSLKVGIGNIRRIKDNKRDENPQLTHK